MNSTRETQTLQYKPKYLVWDMVPDSQIFKTDDFFNRMILGVSEFLF